MKKIFLIIVIVLIFSLSCFGQAVGTIYKLTGTAVLKDSNGKEIQLNQKNFLKVLKAGQQLKANNNSTIEIRFCGNKLKTISGKNWFKITVCASTKAPDWLEDFATAGIKGQTRSDEDFILFPIESEKIVNIIRPQSSIIRWASIDSEVSISLGLVAENKILWEKNKVDGKTGEFASEEFRNLLQKLGNESSDKTYYVKIQTSPNIANTATFKIFSQTQEKVLQEDLSKLKQESGILLSLARANVFATHKLYLEAANEYEEALKFSPDSIELIQITAKTQDAAGNLTRKDELRMKVKNISLNIPN